MSDTLPVLYLGRHGETAWTISRQHRGRADLPLTARGGAPGGPSRRTGRCFGLGVARLSAVGYEQDGSEPVIRFWAELPHERGSGPAPTRMHREEPR
jgi:hypothetical protein